MSSRVRHIKSLTQTFAVASLIAALSASGLSARPALSLDSDANTPGTPTGASKLATKNSGTVKPGTKKTAPAKKATPTSATKPKATSGKPDPKKAKATPIGEKTANVSDNDNDFEVYLDRLMRAESNGRLNAKNPRSSALGPYQFIKSTFLYVARRYLAEQVKDLDDAKILALRTDLEFSRAAAKAYSRENAAHLAGQGIKTTYGNLRLAFLLGPNGAIDILKATPTARVSALLPPAVIRANPFLIRMTAADLIARSNREISIDPSHALSTKGLPKVSARPRIKVRCNLSRPSCRRWLALKRARLKTTAKKKKSATKKVARKKRR